MPSRYRCGWRSSRTCSSHCCKRVSAARGVSRGLPPSSGLCWCTISTYRDSLNIPKKTGRKHWLPWWRVLPLPTTQKISPHSYAREGLDNNSLFEFIEQQLVQIDFLCLADNNNFHASLHRAEEISRCKSTHYFSTVSRLESSCFGWFYIIQKNNPKDV